MIRPSLFRFRTFCLVALVLVLAGCAGLPRRGPANTFPGFDTSFYPGEAALRAWRQSSPYAWIGYYLPSPCHRETSWVGARPVLERQGWGVAVLYVGQQLFEDDTTGVPTSGPILCSRSLLTPEQGRIDGRDAVAKAQAEGFAPGSIVYLDVERMRAVPPEMEAYYRAWTTTVLQDGRYVPGTYAHAENARWLFTVALDVFRDDGRTTTPAFWVAGGPGFSLEQPPDASGFPFASAWQGAIHVRRTWGGVTLDVDENVASRPSPSAPFPPAAPPPP